VSEREDNPDVPIVQSPGQHNLKTPDDDLPVVARLVIEVRSDGTRTVARGALEDQSTGQRVAIQAEGTTPASLASSLMGSLVKLPFFGRTRAVPTMVRQALKALRPGRTDSKK
jgi:hypothetical protein